MSDLPGWNPVLSNLKVARHLFDSLEQALVPLAPITCTSIWPLLTALHDLDRELAQVETRAAERPAS